MPSERAQTPPHISINGDDAEGHDTPKSARSSSGWDGKLRLEKKLELVNPEALSDPEYSDEENVVPGEVIDADEGIHTHFQAPLHKYQADHPSPDLLDDYPLDTQEIDCVHARISSIPSLRLERFEAVTRLCLRQNTITEIESLECLASTLTELDLYDNLIAHIRNLESLTKLTSLDLSFNKIKHIKQISHLVNLTDLYFVQNKISTIENLDGLTKLRNLELAANRIREIQNLETLTGLEELWLGKNKITEMKGLSSLQNLKILSIQSNRIRAISGLDHLPNLEELYISHNALTSLKGLENVIGLRVLDISNNQIASLVGVGHLKQLEELWASYNQIGDFGEVEKELKDKENLNTVYFEGNPLQLKNPTLYRNKVRLALPQIMQIDASKSLGKFYSHRQEGWALFKVRVKVC
jgi:protein phosphatase 1 regulatory subunit 7